MSKSNLTSNISYALLKLLTKSNIIYSGKKTPQYCIEGPPAKKKYCIEGYIRITWEHRETTTGSRAPVNSFKKKMKIVFKSLQKFEIKILVVDNSKIYNPAKSQLKIRCILGYRKKTNLINFKL
jgi:hypothetical protein